MGIHTASVELAPNFDALARRGGLGLEGDSREPQLRSFAYPYERGIVLPRMT
jgi:hypothetical protein